MIQVALVEPVAVTTLEGDLEALRTWHDEFYLSRDKEGRVLKSWNCGNCEICQAIASLKSAISRISS